VAYYGKFQDQYVTEQFQPQITFFNAAKCNGEVDFAPYQSSEFVDQRLRFYQERMIGVVGILSCRLRHQAAEDILIMDMPGQPAFLYDDHRDELGRLVGCWE
jgi:hypothetical protein